MWLRFDSSKAIVKQAPFLEELTGNGKLSFFVRSQSLELLMRWPSV